MKLVPIQRLRPSPLFRENRPRVLYVEDEDINWEITEHELRDRCDITRARNAREAFSLLAENRYHLIMLDIQLSRSEIDGLDIARILKGRYSGPVPAYAQGVQAMVTPIVFITAYTARYKKIDVIEAGGEDLVQKPVNYTILSLVIARLWARASGGVNA